MSGSLKIFLVFGNRDETLVLVIEIVRNVVGTISDTKAYELFVSQSQVFK